jgi:putative ABC transport system permease protein
MITIATLLSCMELGLIYSLVVMPVWLSSTIIRFYDLSVEGSFCTGGAITALLLHLQCPAIFTIPAALASGALIGLCTGLLHAGLGLNDLLSGIIVTTGLFSINLAMVSSNRSLAQVKTVFSSTAIVPFGLGNLLLLLIIALSLFLLLQWLLTTEIGLVVRASGENPALLRDIGKHQGLYTTLVLMCANASVALAGSLFVQYVGFFSIWTAVGILVIALTGLKIGQLVNKQLGLHLIMGAILYQAIIALTLELGMPPEWNKLITALLMVVLMSITHMQRK